jgi:hypothetical protein
LERAVDVYHQLLRKDMERLNGDDWDPKRMDDEVAALFACPLVFCPAGNDPIATGKVVGVLFADSTQVGAFDGACVAQIIASCEEFGRYLERTLGSNSEVISVNAQATSYSADHVASAQILEKLTVLKASAATPPRVPVEHINLEWWT